MGVFYIDFEHAKDVFQICKWLQGSMRKTWYLHQKMYASHQVSRGKIENPKFRVQGWCASKVRWCVGRVCLSQYIGRRILRIWIQLKLFGISWRTGFKWIMEKEWRILDFALLYVKHGMQQARDSWIISLMKCMIDVRQSYSRRQMVSSLPNAV